MFEILSACLPALLMACEIPHNHRRIDAPRRVVIKCRLPIQRLIHQSFLHRTLKWRSAFLASSLKSLSKFTNNCRSKFEWACFTTIFLFLTQEFNNPLQTLNGLYFTRRLKNWFDKKLAGKWWYKYRIIVLNVQFILKFNSVSVSCSKKCFWPVVVAQKRIHWNN